MFVFAFLGIGAAVGANVYFDIAKYRFVILKTKESWSFKALVSAAILYDTALISVNSLRSLLTLEPLAETSPLPTIRLKLEPSAIKKMVSYLPDSAKEKYYRGQMLYPDGSWQNIRFRLRGRNIWHWHPDKPSLRIVLKRTAPLDLQRHLNLVNPEDRTMLANPYGEELGRRLGILAPRTRMARVFVNEEYKGVYQLTTREDENMLRLNKRMPGPLFIGDKLGRRWEPDQFEVTGEEAILQRRNPLGKFVDALYKPLGPDRYESLWSIADMEKVAGWHALLNLTGGGHTDYHHNHLYYFDPTTGLLEPVVSDILALGALLYPGARARLTQPFVPAADLPVNEKLHPLFDAALRDPRYHHLRNQKLFEAMNGLASTEAQQALLRSMLAEIDRDVRADRLKASVMETFAGWFRVPYGNGQFENAKALSMDWIARRNSFLIAQLNDSAVRATVVPVAGGEDSLILVEVNGNAAVSFDPHGLPGQITADRSLKGEGFVPVAGRQTLFPGLREDGDFYYELTEDRRLGPYYLMPDWQRYLFRVQGGRPDRISTALGGAFRNAITGTPVTPELVTDGTVDPGAITYNATGLHAWALPKPPAGEVVLGPGVVRLADTLNVGPEQQLLVRPGTHLRLGPGISIVARGKVRIEGTADAPVTVARLEADQPWGVLAIQGRAAADSAISHADIKGGSVATTLNIDYSGMVSVHWAGRIAIHNTRIAGNVIGDDTLHLVHSVADVRNVSLENCFGDCIDLDYMSGRLSDIRIRNSSNDALDFMTSTVRIERIDLDGVGDKGISGGEGSTLAVNDFRIARANTGIAVKDGSSITAVAGLLEKNFVAIDVFAKNQRYGGPGNIDLADTRFDDNQVDLRTEEGGTATFRGQPVPTKVAGDGAVSAE